MYLQSDTAKLLAAALEVSVYVVPAEPGLTRAELVEVGRQQGLKDGEIGDAIGELERQCSLSARLMLPSNVFVTAGYLSHVEEPDLRNHAAFDAVVHELNELVRDVGAANARLDRVILVDRAAARSIARHDVEVAIAVLVLSGQLVEKDGTVRFASGGVRPVPSVVKEQGTLVRYHKPLKVRVLPTVRDVVARRGDGRPKTAEPFDTFADQLQYLGYGQFRLWWNRVVAELRRTDPSASPLAALVLAAALVEGVLTFVVKHARKRGFAVFGSADYEKDPRTWNISDLVASAARGGDTSILDVRSKLRTEMLIQTRHRIHAGRMLSEFAQGVPDLRPEEARAGKETAELVVRRVLDWLEKYPART